jgi:hypothetical protein
VITYEETITIGILFEKKSEKAELTHSWEERAKRSTSCISQGRARNYPLPSEHL